MFSIHEKFIPVIIGAGVAAAALTVEKVVERMFSYAWEVEEEEPEDDEPEEDVEDDDVAQGEKKVKEVRLVNAS